jgi:hypothetical protein
MFHLEERPGTEGIRSVHGIPTLSQVFVINSLLAAACCLLIS